MEMEPRERRALESRAWRVVSQHAILPWVIRFADLPERARVLEIGSGAGFEAEVLLDRYPAWEFVATDRDPAMVVRCKEQLGRFGERVVVQECDAIALPFAPDTFDLAISIGVWHHVGSWDRALAECARVLRPGGSLLLVDVLPGFFKGPLAKLFPAGRAYTLSEMRAQLGAAGFGRFRVRAAGSLWYRLVAEMPTG